MSSLKVVGESDSAGTDVLLCFRPGAPGYNQAWYTLANTGIFWDPVSGNDNNTGASSGAAVQTWAEIVRRFGSNAPEQTYGSNIIINKLSAQSAGVDPVYFYPKITGGGHAALIDTLSVFSAAAAIGTVTLLNKASGTDMTVATVPAGVTAGMYAFNSTSGSYAFVKSVSTGTATMTQPIPTSNVTTIGIPAGALATNWATGDTVTWYNIPNLTNLKAWQPSGGDVSSGGAASVGWVQWTQIADASAGAATAVYLMTNECATSALSGCYVAPRLHIAALGGRGNGNFVSGCFVVGACVIVSGPCEIYGGTLGSTLTVSAGNNFNTIDGNIIITGASTFYGTTAYGSAHFVGLISIIGCVLQASASSSTIWGAAGITVFPNAALVVNAGSTFAATLLNTGTLLLGASTTGSSYTGNGVFADGVTLTPAHMDTGGAGGKGLQNLLIGARYCLSA